MNTPIASGDSADRRYTFTVFTPTYNRAHTLPRVYESLRAQTLRDFEWLVIDDGSTDGTAQLFEKWNAEANFPLRYARQQHQGKHVAFNRGVEQAQGELFLNLDSDDACVPHALERFKHHWDAIPKKQRLQFSAVTALCVDQHGKLIGTTFPRDATDSDSLEIRYKFRVKGEKWGFHRTSVLRQFPFPVLGGYVPESIVWAAIARKFKTRFVNEPLRIYWADESGHPDQITKLRRPAQNAPGGALWHKSVLNGQTDWFWCAPQQFLRSAVQFSRYSFHIGVDVRKQAGSLTNFRAKALWALMLPAGIAAHLCDRRGIPVGKF
jgi:glycosyltransferase involved in cell wall biosynthesis